jgi:hypothetical protein
MYAILFILILFWNIGEALLSVILYKILAKCLKVWLNDVMHWAISLLRALTYFDGGLK